MRTFVMALALATAMSAPSLAQDSVQATPDNAIRPGMSEADVRARWGEPLTVRRANDWTYLFYRSGVEHIHRFNDVVFLQNGQVVDAVIRAPGRTYLGQSSSPPSRAPENTPPANRPSP
jgi:hypothetical protein